jgi:hypothetical protein
MQLCYEKHANKITKQNLQPAVNDSFQAENGTKIYAISQYEVGHTTRCNYEANTFI